MVPDIVDPLSRIDAVLSQAERHIAAVFRASIAQLKDQVDLTELAGLLEAGRFEEALDRLTIAGERLAQAVNNVFISSANSTATFLQSAGVISIGFDQVNFRAVNAMMANNMRLVREFSTGQREAVQVAMTAGITTGIGPREQARSFRDVIGLTARQAQAVVNYRRLLERVGNPDESEASQAESLTRRLRDGRTDRTVQSFIRRKRRLPRAQIDRMVARYSERTVKYRAEVIARTDGLRSVHQGARATYAQMIERGAIDPARLEREWHTSIDGRERLSHRVMHHQLRGWDEAFDSLHGPIMYPGDPEAPAEETIQCRCLVTVRLKANRRVA
jgi:hypothetical protein